MTATVTSTQPSRLIRLIQLSGSPARGNSHPTHQSGDLFDGQHDSANGFHARFLVGSIKAFRGAGRVVGQGASGRTYSGAHPI